jgi:hypothetical protein
VAVSYDPAKSRGADTHLHRPENGRLVSVAPLLPARMAMRLTKALGIIGILPPAFA